ncbi:MAG: HEAT repeat domain-containing protein, partial [Planctomycetota bacterium]
MALFEKNSEVGSFLKRLQSGAVDSAEELKELCEYVFAHPEVELHEESWLFTHPKKMVRQYAARRAHQSLRPGRIVDSLLSAMARADAELRREMARLVGELVADRLSEYLPDLIHAGEAAKREVAVDLIGKSGRIIDHLGSIKVLLRDDASKIRQRAVKLLAREPDNPTVFIILRGLIHDENEAIRTIVIDTLSKRPDPEIIEPFFERLA